jgi:ATP-binding cassette subfamily C (CFTR/MRP) protein 4
VLVENIVITNNMREVIKNKIIDFLFRIAQPMFLGRLIDHFSPDSTVTESEAYLSALGIILCSSVSIVVMHPYMMGIMHTGMKVRVASCSLIYRKVYKLAKDLITNILNYAILPIQNNCNPSIF